MSKPVGKGKWKYKGKVGVWRTTNAGDRIFIPDGGGAPLAMNKHTEKHTGKKKPGMFGAFVSKAKKQLKKLLKKKKPRS
jgi:hypothetical protein